MTSNNLEFSEKISLLTELGKSNSIQDKDKKKIYDVDRHLVSSFGAWWNKDWEKTFKTDDQKIFLLKGLILLEKIDSVKFANKEYSDTEKKYDLELAKKIVRKLL